MKENQKLDERLVLWVSAEEKEALRTLAEERSVPGGKAVSMSEIVRLGTRAYLRRMKAL